MEKIKHTHRKKVKISLTQSTIVVLDMVREVIRRIYGPDKKIENLNIKEIEPEKQSGTATEDFRRHEWRTYWVCLHFNFESTPLVFKCSIYTDFGLLVWDPAEIIAGKHPVQLGQRVIKPGKFPPVTRRFKYLGGRGSRMLEVDENDKPIAL
ncbi:hypothetical protein KJ969_03245 [Patescibacteria group bacterium]|nr:hypothetical protein [Patescibacteria group bacterium]MBU1922237.1 hypothetical protein [Patescibacteria group bacterium]